MDQMAVRAKHAFGARGLEPVETRLADTCRVGNRTNGGQLTKFIPWDSPVEFCKTRFRHLAWMLRLALLIVACQVNDEIFTCHLWQAVLGGCLQQQLVFVLEGGCHIGIGACDLTLGKQIRRAPIAELDGFSALPLWGFVCPDQK